jgi:uncharacterized protein
MKLALQHCNDCGTHQYPPRELCSTCLSSRLEWHATDREAGNVLAVTTLHHSHDAAFRPRLPLAIALVRLDCGPSVVCFASDVAPGQRVHVTAAPDSERRPVLTACPA